MSTTYHRKKNFTPDEDAIILEKASLGGKIDFATIASLLPDRSARQCRERYNNYLRPGLSKEPWSPEEDQQLINLYQQYSGSWTKISKHISGRSSNDCKNRWYVHVQKQLFKNPLQTISSIHEECSSPEPAFEIFVSNHNQAEQNTIQSQSNQNMTPTPESTIELLSFFDDDDLFNWGSDTEEEGYSSFQFIDR